MPMESSIVLEFLGNIQDIKMYCELLDRCSELSSAFLGQLKP
jgi:hypothetical protein